MAGRRKLLYGHPLVGLLRYPLSIGTTNTPEAPTTGGVMNAAPRRSRWRSPDRRKLSQLVPRGGGRTAHRGRRRPTGLLEFLAWGPGRDWPHARRHRGARAHARPLRPHRLRRAGEGGAEHPGMDPRERRTADETAVVVHERTQPVRVPRSQDPADRGLPRPGRGAARGPNP